MSEKAYINVTQLEFFEQVVHAAPIGILKVSLDGHILEANETAENYFEYQESELQNVTFQELTPRASDLDTDIKLLEDCINGSPGYSMTKLYITKSLSTFWAFLKVVPIRVNGELKYFLSFILKHQDMSRLSPDSVNSENYMYKDLQKRMDEILMAIDKKLEEKSAKQSTEDDPVWKKIMGHVATKIAAGILAAVGFTYEFYQNSIEQQQETKNNSSNILEIRGEQQDQRDLIVEILNTLKDLKK